MKKKNLEQLDTLLINHSSIEFFQIRVINPGVPN
jgi:hypothetical protein